MSGEQRMIGLNQKAFRREKKDQKAFEDTELTDMEIRQHVVPIYSGINCNTILPHANPASDSYLYTTW